MNDAVAILTLAWAIGIPISALVVVPVYAWNGWFKPDPERYPYPAPAFAICLIWPLALLYFIIQVPVKAVLNLGFRAVDRIEAHGEAYRARKLSQANGQALQEQRLNLPVVAEETEEEQVPRLERLLKR